MRRNSPKNDMELLAIAAAQADAAARLAAELAGLDLSQLELGPVPDPPPLHDLPLADLWGCELLGDAPPPLPDLPDPLPWS